MGVFTEIGDELSERFKECDDFAMREFSSGERRYRVYYIKNFSSRDMINKYIIAPIAAFHGEKSVFDAVCFSSAERVFDADKAEEALISGASVVMAEGDDFALCVMTKNEEGRSQSEPETENVIRGAHEGFTENGGSNVMLLRRRIKSANLKTESILCGTLSRTEVTMVYLDGVVREDVLARLRLKLADIKINGVLDSGYIEMYIQDGRYPIYPTVGNSERPDKVAAKILEGRVAIVVDGSPVVLTVPYLFIEGFQVSEDYSKSTYFATFERLLRFFGTVISLFLPAFFLVCASEPSLMPKTLTSYIAEARKDIKMELLAEMMIVFLLFELVREVGLRMPKAVGSAVGIVGSLVLGDSAVEAGFISAPVLIVVALSAVCNFLAPPYMNSNVIYRTILMLCSGFFGIFGFFFASTVGIFMFCKKTSFGAPYLFPMAPMSLLGQRDFLLMLPIWRQSIVPRVLSDKITVRAEEKHDKW